MDKSYWVYILASRKRGTLYVGVSNDLEARMHQHRTGQTKGFAWLYGCRRLVWFEMHHDIEEAIWREKAIKRWLRAWKVQMIEAENPDWHDLAADWFPGQET
ncbi:GIY-YIG nuclease family protein [Prosthecomicrobium sp. N25]|uniref:GIY-YIG nuclease family protein n=1 Tax=Prosthecomicrobium sp. N25 TaxID=3129254 RepID=UPI003076B537